MAEAFALKRRQVAAYGAAAFGGLLGFGVVPLLFLYYLTEYAKMPPAWAGVLLALPKLADLLLDPWLGRRCDAYAGQHGSRASLLGVSLLALPLVLVLLFVPLTGLPPALRLAVLAVLLVAQSLLTTVFAVGHTALSGDVAPTLAARGTLMSARAFGATLAGLVVAAAAPALVAAFGDGQGGYFAMALTLAAISAALLLVSWRFFRGTPMLAGVESTAAGPRPGLLPALRATLRNKPFYAVTAMLVLMGTGSGTLVALMPYVNQHLLGGTAAQLPLLLAPIFIVLLAGVSAAPWVLRRLGPTAALTAGLVVALGGIGLLAGGPRVLASMATGAAVFGFGAGLLTVLVMTLGTQFASQSSAGGESMGLYLGVLFSAEKLGASAGGIIAGFGLGWAGLAPGGTAALNPDRLAAVWLWVPVLAMGSCLALLAWQAAQLSRLRGTGFSETV